MNFQTSLNMAIKKEFNLVILLIRIFYPTSKTPKLVKHKMKISFNKFRTL